MTGKEALKALLTSTQSMVPMYFKDLSDSDIQTPPVPGANNIAWQMGHLIASEVALGQAIGGQYPDLPPELKILGKTETAKTNPDGGKLPVSGYLDWFSRVRNATVAAVDKMSDADLDRPNNGPMKDFAPTVGHLVVLVGNHTFMHVGQFSVVRRALKKPVLF
jgi:hypothetical protein